ncbi:Arm repeat superfamily protein, partial [Thalictrum thalictroides]
MRNIVEEIKFVIITSSKRMRKRAKSAKAKYIGAEKKQEVFDEVGDCLGTLVKPFKASFSPFFDELLMIIEPMWGKKKTAKERKT